MDFTPKGWFIKYLDKNPLLKARQEAIERQQAKALDDEQRQTKRLAEQVEAAKALAAEAGLDADAGEAKELQREEGQKVAVSLGSSSLKPVAKKKELENVFTQAGGKAKSSSKKLKAEKRSAMDDIISENEAMKAKKQKLEKKKRTDYWLCPGIVVKVVNKKLRDGMYYKQKGVVRSVKERYVAEIKMIKSQHTLSIDQSELETVIPAIGREVRIVNGEYRDETGQLVELDQKRFSVTVKLTSGDDKGRQVPDIPLEDVCKMA